MEPVTALAAAVAATAFTADLAADFRRRARPHTAAYAAGMAMFAIATWALVVGLFRGWDGPTYRVFFLFGAILNIPFLALGSMFLVVGRRSGHVMFLLLGALAAVSTTLVTTVPFTQPLPASGIPHGVFPPISEGFGPRLLAAISGGTGAILIIGLAVVSVFRFWRRNRPVVTGNLLIVAGTLAAGSSGTALGFLGETTAFSLSLLAAATLIWAGYRVARRGRRQLPSTPTILLAGPSTESPERAHAELMISALERAGYRVVCPARDLEDWGAVGFTPAEAMRLIFREIEEATAVVVDLAHGYGVGVAAGYARARGIPVIVAAQAGTRIPRPLRGVASAEVFYHLVDDVAAKVVELHPPPGSPELEPAG